MSITLDFEPGAVIVAGGSGGIGEAIARRFADAGLPVMITCHRNEQKAAAICADIRAAGGQCDYRRVEQLSRPGVADALLEEVRALHGAVGHVVYAAGPHFEFNFIGAIPDEDWQRVVDADINGAFQLIQAAVRGFRAQESGGNLVAVITSAVERVPVKDILSAAPKAAIEMLIRGVAKESGRFGIRANCVGPGWINAGLGKDMVDRLPEKEREALRKQAIPLRRFGEADDIAYATLFLCSRQAGFVTGQSLAVDGGLQL